MLAKSKFEQGLDLLEQAIPLLRQAYAEQETAIRQGIIATISGGGQVTSAGTITPAPKPPKSDTGKAPRGAARAFVKKLLAGTKRGMVWGDIEEAAKNSGEITHWAVRKEINKGRKEGRYYLRSGRWVLKEEVA
jgi:hypothetical protein